MIDYKQIEPRISVLRFACCILAGIVVAVLLYVGIWLAFL